MSNTTNTTRHPLQGNCPDPFLYLPNFPDEGGFIEGRLCSEVQGLVCCLPCPMTDWVYPDNFSTLTMIADWINVVGMACCIFLLLSWAFLPIEKTNRHYLSICLCCAVVLMNLGFIVPLAANPPQCFNEITPNGMESNSTCAASGAFLLFGGFAGVMWVFLRSVSLHLQICWQVTVGHKFMWLAQGVGWGVPLVGVVVAMVLSGVSFRFGATCHINHKLSLEDFWIPLLIFAGLTVIISFATFGYCIKVYLASLADNGPSTEGSGMPSYSNSIRTLTPRQAYKRVRRVIALQWRGITIVLIIVMDVIFFSVVFVFQDATVSNVKEDPSLALDWITCLTVNRGNKDVCLDKSDSLVIPQATAVAVLILLAFNGIWLLFLLGRWSMVTAWIDLAKSLGGPQKSEFVSVDARLDYKRDTRSYEMLSRDSGKTLDSLVTPTQGPTPIDRSMSPPTSPPSGRRTPDYFSHAPAPTARYKPPPRSFNSPQPPQSRAGYESPSPPPQAWDPQQHYRPIQRNPNGDEEMNPLAMNRI